MLHTQQFLLAGINEMALPGKCVLESHGDKNTTHRVGMGGGGHSSHFMSLAYSSTGSNATLFHNYSMAQGSWFRKINRVGLKLVNDSVIDNYGFCCQMGLN